jgi:hypothetical protein
MASYLQFLEVFKAEKKSSVIFRVMTPCGFVGGYQHLRGTYCHPDDEGGIFP